MNPEVIITFTFANDAVGEDGWAQVAPFGDFPGVAVVANADGSYKEFRAIQRIDRQAAEKMAGNFKSFWGRVKRYLSGCPIFHGHPDMANAGNRYPDKTAKGAISDLEVRDDGLYAKPIFFNEGIDLLTQNKKLFFSGRWSSQPIGEENGKKVFRPDELKSVALTDRPNLPVHFVNERPTHHMKTSLILPILALHGHGVTFANAAEPTEQEIADAMKAISDTAQTVPRLKQEKAELANEKTALEGRVNTLTGEKTTLTTELATAKTEFQNERNARIGDELARAQRDGRITAAEAPQWKARLENPAQFANELTALTALTPKVKTTSVTITRGDRRVEIANETERRGLVQELITEIANEKHLDPVKDYAALYNEAQRRHPALFEAMKQPQLHVRK